MSTPVLVALGAACGAMLRYLTAHHLDRPLVSHWGTFLVNVTGSLLLGVFAAGLRSAAAISLLGVGFCGALTTYSSVTVQAVNLPRHRGLGYAAGTVLACLLAAWLGWQVTRLLQG